MKSGGRLLQEDVTRLGRWLDLDFGCRRVHPGKLAELEFAWRAVRSVKSNAIWLAHEGATVGVGMGQVMLIGEVGC